MAATPNIMTSTSDIDALAGNQTNNVVTGNMTIGGTLTVAGFPVGGGASVSTVSIVTAHGISGSVATATTTPAITLTLGAITPSSVASTGAVSGTNVALTGLFETTVNLVNPVANGATVNLSATQTYNVLRPTSDGTITGAIINLPTTSLVDGQRCTVSTTGTITTITGTVSSAPIPVLSTLTAGQSVSFVYNLGATTWFRI